MIRVKKGVHFVIIFCSIARLRHLEFAEAVVWRLYRKYGLAGWARGVSALWDGLAIHRVGKFWLHLNLRSLWAQPGFHMGSAWVDPGFNPGSNWVQPGFNLGSTCVPPGFKLGSKWVHLGFNLGSTWVQRGFNQGSA